MTSFYVSRVKVCREVFSLFHHYNCYEAKVRFHQQKQCIDYAMWKQLRGCTINNCVVCFFAMKMKICLGVERFFWESRDFLRLRDFLWKLRDFFESWRLFWKLKVFLKVEGFFRVERFFWRVERLFLKLRFFWELRNLLWEFRDFYGS